MTTVEEARIFLADRRGVSQSEAFRSYHLLAFGDYREAGREPFGVLQALNDDTLAPGISRKMEPAAGMEVLLLPVAGSLAYTDASGREYLLEPGDAARVSPGSYTVRNPYDTGLINFLQIWRSAAPPASKTIVFDLSKKNTLHDLSIGRFWGIGQYEGRQEGTCRPGSSRVFVYVLEGVFEVQDRLLHPRDGLALTGAETIGWEALSDNAILLLIEA
ncbi:MAG: pirin [Siphonobacter aquaeclarae]|nr:pirin [Siphonobacter aquaeclarae]